jgi:hypothetical protein
MFLAMPLSAQFYNGSQMEFGKNRVQYKHIDWQLYRFDRFDVYFYLGGNELAEYTMRSSDRIMRDLEKTLDFSLDKRIEVVIYNKLSDLKQSNIGLVTDQHYNIGGVTHIVGTKLMLYFDGDYVNFEKQLRAGLTRVMVDQMMYGGNLRNVIRGSTLLNIPEWFTEGLVSYLSRDWDAEVNNRVKDGIMSGRWKQFNRLEGDDARDAGHSIWKYVVETYGASVLSNILYMTRVSRNADNGFLFVIGVALKNLSAEWFNYYDSMYYRADGKLALPEGKPINRVRKRPRPLIVLEEPRLSRNGEFVSYVRNDMGRIRVRLRDLEKKKEKNIYRQGFRTHTKMDRSYPITAWHPGSDLISIITEHKGKIWLVLYNVRTRKREKRELFHFEKILSVDYSDNGREFVFTAVQMGRSDVYIYNIISNTYQKLTDDIFTDRDARFMDRSRKVIFSSNRNNDTIRQFDGKLLPRDLDFDIFIYDRDSKDMVLRRVTDTRFVNETMPKEYDGRRLSYLSDATGTVNRYVAELDSAIAYIDTTVHYRYFTRSEQATQYPRNVEGFDVDTFKGRIAEVLFANGNYRLTLKDRGAELASKTIQAPYSGYRPKGSVTQPPKKVRVPSAPLPGEKEIRTAPLNTPLPEQTGSATDGIDIANYKFDVDVPGEPKSTPTSGRKDPDSRRDRRNEKAMSRIDSLNLALQSVQVPTEDFQLPKQRNYDVAFKVEDVVTQLDNNFINSSYQRFTGGGGFFNPGLNGLIKMGISDILDDYKIVGGFRITGNLGSNEFFLSAQNYKRRMDKQLIFHRQTFEQLVNQFTLAKVYTHTLNYKMSWPFSDFSAVRGSVFGRNDRTVLKSTSDRTLTFPDDHQWMAGLKAEYVFDNVLPMGPNLYRGTRLKVFVEYYQDLDAQAGNLFVVGTDIRHYIKVHRELIWANRLAGSTSFGTQKLIYFLGGVDQWILPEFDNSIPIDFSQNYAFQSLATNLRGFPQNIRNGNSFAVINSELRWPIFRYLLNRPIKSDFIYNLQIVGFGDIGTAWTSTSPFSEENSLNREVIEQGSVTITLNNRREPVIGGFGLGVRTKLLGYFIRLDHAWGVENYAVNDGIWYFSLSLDF